MSIFSTGTFMIGATLLDGVGATEIHGTTSTSASTVYSYQIPGGLLSTQHALDLDLAATITNNACSTDLLTWKATYGAQTLYQDTISLSSSTGTNSYRIHARLKNVDATNAQTFWWEHLIGNRTKPTVGWSGLSTGDQLRASGIGTTSTQDSTTNLTFSVTLLHSSTSTGASFQRQWATLCCV